jgi:hypothetical protein
MFLFEGTRENIEGLLIPAAACTFRISGDALLLLHVHRHGGVSRPATQTTDFRLQMSKEVGVIRKLDDIHEAEDRWNRNSTRGISQM